MTSSDSILRSLRTLLVFGLAMLGPGSRQNARASDAPAVIRTEYGIQKPTTTTNSVGESPLAFDLAWARSPVPDYRTNPVVVIDAAMDAGQLVRDGVAVGDYRFYRIPSPTPTDTNPLGWILQIQYLSPLVNLHEYFYAVDAPRSGYAFFGLSPFLGQRELEIDKAFHATLLKLVYQPTAFATRDLVYLDDPVHRSVPLMDNAVFYAAFLPFLYRMELTANRVNHDLDFTYSGNLPSSAWPANSSAGSPSEMDAMAQALAEAWEEIPVLARVPYFAPFQNGATRTTMELLARLILDFLARTGDPQVVSPGPRRDQLARIVNSLVPLILETPALNPSLRDELVDAIAAEIPEYLRRSTDADGVIEFLAATLPDPRHRAAPERLARLRDLLRRLLVGNTLYPGHLAHFARALTAYLDAEAVVRANERLAEILESPSPLDPAVLIDCFRLPLTESNLAKLTDRVAQLPSVANGQDLPYFFIGVSPDGARSLPAGLRQQLFSSFASSLTQHFPERSPLDYYQAAFDGLVSQALRAVRVADGFATNAPLFLPLLRLTCPRQPGETDSAYADRFAVIESLWSQDRVFLYDLNGGSFAHPEFLPVFADFARTHPGWLHLLLLALDEPGRAEVNGGAQFDWKTYFTPWLIGNSLLHEGGHSLDLLGDPADPRIDQISRYWYAHRPDDRTRSVSEYSHQNPREFWAEHTRYWFQDTRTWFARAVERYREGEPGMLHLFLFLWNLPRPVDAPTGDQLPVYLLQENGLLQRDYVPAAWKTGDMDEGEFVTTMDGHTYTFRYREGLIRSLQQDDLAAVRLAAPPTFLLPTRLRLEAGTTLVLTNLVQDSDNETVLSILEAPPGLSLDPTTRSLTWQSGTVPAGTRHVIRLQATTTGSPALSNTHQFTVTVEEVNHPPVLEAPATEPQVVPGQFLRLPLQFADPDQPADQLSFSLEGSAPPESSVSPDGLLTWRVPANAAPGLRTFGVTVTDDGTPRLSATTTIQIRVKPARSVEMQARRLGANQLEISITGDDDVAYVLEASFDLVEWKPLNTVLLTGGAARVEEALDPLVSTRFLRVRVP